MINLYKAFILCLVLPLILMGCTREKSTQIVKITIHAVGMKAAGVELSTVNLLSLESITLALAQVDSAGAGFMGFNLSKPVLGFLEIGGKGTQILLAPGDDLQVYVDSKSAATPVSFAGKGAEANNYLVKAFLVQEKFENAGGKSYFDLNPQEFLARLDSLEIAFADFHSDYTDTVALPKGISALLESKNKLKILSLKQNYFLSRYDDINTDAGISEKFKNISEEVPFDTTLLNSGMFEYAFSLHMYMESKFYAPLASAPMPETSARPKDYFLTKADQAIKQEGYLPGIREFLIAKNLYSSMSNNGITPGVDTIYADFKKKYRGSAYLPSLEKKYGQWLAISAGKPAPELTGITPAGKAFSLSDLKGKIVYVDVWATWCGPCLKEIPYAKKIAKHFDGNKQVVFLYVSVDQDKEAWKKMLAADKGFKGIHILEQPAGNTASIMETYVIKGIPRYMLIDQEGNIVQADASRPSSGKVIGEIEEILMKKKIAML